MKKFSRRYGWMWLVTFASGDGSISFIWTDAERNGRGVSEPVTESDVSEYLRDPETEKKWEGWIILDSGVPTVRLARDVVRPFHTSCRLELDGRNYWYSDKDGTFEFYVDKRDKRVDNLDIITSLTYFLKNEIAFSQTKQERR